MWNVSALLVKNNYKVLFWLVMLLALLLAARQAWPAAGPEPAGGLRLNEFVASNGTGLADEDGDYSDWIEIYNPGPWPVNLAGWALSDDPAQPDKWTFPSRTLAGGEYLVVFASGKDRKPPDQQGELHTNFKLNADTEIPLLYNMLDDMLIRPGPPEPDRTLPQFRDMAYGRHGRKYGYLAPPTPGGPNDASTAWAGVVGPVRFSAGRGFYQAPFTLALNCATPGATIRYTLDGSPPTEREGLVYKRPLDLSGTAVVRAAAFKPGWLPSAVETHSYLFLAQVLNQPANPPGFPPTWGTHTRDYEANKAGEPVQADYEMDPEVVNDPRYRDRLVESLQAIPTLSLVTAPADFDIYANPRERGLEWERPVSAELIYPHKEQPGFQMTAGIRIQGGEGRYEYVPKHSFRLFFRGKYGATRLEYPIFPDSAVESFDTLVLRGGVSSSYAGISLVPDDLATYTRDEWVRASQIAMSGVGSHGMFVHLYINGLYWGLYNVVERPDEAFMASYLGGEKEDWYVINQGGPIKGDSERFDTLYQMVGGRDESGLEEPEKYARIKQYLDTAHFIDYALVNWYAGNQDWPDQNWYAGVRSPAGQVRHFVWDAEYVWMEGAKIRFGSWEGHFKPLFRALIKNPDFQMEFADRTYKHLFNDGPLADANAQARWQAINGPVEQAIIGESARWGDVRADPPLTQQDWLAAQEFVLAQMAGNAGRLLAQLRQSGYYPAIDPPRFNRQGGLVQAGFSVVMTATTGSTIYYTLDGSDPRQAVSGQVAPTARLYGEPLVLTDTTRLKSRARQGETWSALNEATFSLVVQDRQLRLGEIMYNPPGGSGYEFIELVNIGDTAIDISSFTFEGIDFTFPPNSAPLAPGQVVVLASNAANFARRYPEVTPAGVYGGQLSNAGETITLRDAAGRVVITVQYDDEGGWPISADGRGDSLVLARPEGDPTQAKNWRASTDLHGSPGQNKP